MLCDPQVRHAPLGEATHDAYTLVELQAFVQVHEGGYRNARATARSARRWIDGSQIARDQAQRLLAADREPELQAGSGRRLPFEGAEQLGRHSGRKAAALVLHLEDPIDCAQVVVSATRSATTCRTISRSVTAPTRCPARSHTGRKAILASRMCLATAITVSSSATE